MKRLLIIKWYLNSIVAFIIFNLLRIKYRYKYANERGIIFINTGTLGDVVISSMLLDLDIPEEITLIVKKEYSDLFADYNGKNKILFLEHGRYKWSIRYRFNFLRQLHSLKAGLCINLTSARGISSDEIALLSGADSIGCFHNSWEKLPKVFKKKIDSYYDKIFCAETTNEYDRHFELISLLLEDKKEYQVIKERLTSLPGRNNKEVAAAEKFIVIAPLSSDKTRTWGNKNYKLFCDQISDKIKVYLVGTDEERETVETIISGNDKLTNLAGKLKLNDLSALIKNSALFIGNDSGLTHLALKLGVPLIAIIGGGNFDKYFPYRSNSNRVYFYHILDCFGCEWNCRYNEKYCLTKVNPDEVFEKALNLTGLK